MPDYESDLRTIERALRSVKPLLKLDVQSAQSAPTAFWRQLKDNVLYDVELAERALARMLAEHYGTQQQQPVHPKQTRYDEPRY